jgi:rubrerythrin
MGEVTKFIERIMNGTVDADNPNLQKDSHECPECGSQIILSEGCAFCPSCGWSPCK